MANIIWLLPNYVLSLIIIAQISQTKGQICSIQDKSEIGTRITDGFDSFAHQAPWNIVMELKINQNEKSIQTHCGGNIISSTLILTAAHCLWQNNNKCPPEFRNQTTAAECHESTGRCPDGCLRVRPQDLNIYIGIQSINQTNRTPLNVKSIVIHEKWNKRTFIENSLGSGNDLAILKLQTELKFYEGVVEPISLPSDLYTRPEGNVTLYGFGFIEINFGQPGKPAWCLQRGDLQIINNDTCPKAAGDPICAISAGPGLTDACLGDSGSGLVKTVDGENVLVGIVSFGSKWCNSEGIYTNVKTHMSWIRQNLLNVIGNKEGATTASKEEEGAAQILVSATGQSGSSIITANSVGLSRGSSIGFPGGSIGISKSLTCEAPMCQVGNQCCSLQFNPFKREYECPPICI